MASGPTTSWQIDGETVETVSDFIFLGSKIIADGDCSHEIKRHLLPGRKVMTNLDSIFKSRDISLPKEVHLFKAIVFPLVMYACESWTVKKAEHWRIDAFELWCWRRLLWVPWTARRSNQSKGDQSWVFIGRTDAKAETGRGWWQEEMGMTEDEMAGWHHRLDGLEFEWTLGVGDGRGGLVCCNSWGCKELQESNMTEQLNWTELNLNWDVWSILTGGFWGSILSSQFMKSLKT